MGNADNWIPVITLVIGLLASPVVSAVGFLTLRHFKRRDDYSSYRRQAMSDVQVALLRLQRARFEYTQLPNSYQGQDAITVVKEALEATKLVRFHATRIGDDRLKKAVSIISSDSITREEIADYRDINDFADVLAEIMAEEWRRP